MNPLFFLFCFLMVLGIIFFFIGAYQFYKIDDEEKKISEDDN